jgi:integrase
VGWAFVDSAMARARTRRRGYLEQLPSGSVRAVVFVGTDPLTGRPRYLRETHRTAGEAEVALTKLLRQVDQQQHPKSAITVREAVEQWLEVAELGVTTREQYDDLMRLYIDPTLGTTQAGKLDAELLERFYARLLRCKHLYDLQRAISVGRWARAASVRSTTFFGRPSTERCVGATSRSIPPSWSARPRLRHRIPIRRPLRRPRPFSMTPGAIPSGGCCCG